ncbi:MAG TPA: nucleotidyltransferase [Opitutaceae bacterium]|jgi:predicted nucleotidyltransferase|nr:nucleotidyltransferase [Opitutaceae bacterium]
MEKLDRNFADFLKLLNSHGVEYLVIGGYAVGYHGFVRATGDLDIFVGISDQNAEGLLAVFREFGFDAPRLKKELFLEKDKIVRIGQPPLRIEVLNAISGVSFAEAYGKRIEEPIDGVRVPFIDLASLLKNKAASGRLKDLADIEALTKKGRSSR